MKLLESLFVSIIYTLKRWRNYSGRSSRLEFWLYMLFLIASVTCLFSLNTVIEPVSSVAATVIAWLVLIFIYVPALAVMVRRLHDLNITGWALAINLLPVVGGGIILIAMIWPGTKSQNQFGPVTSI